MSQWTRAACARFCLRTGRAVTPPAYQPVQRSATRLFDGVVEAEVPA
ncbi:MAG TPA: hypothetical protein VMT50_09540 [Steroidobacteraceae bacterium]|nr:hypothetical protein [Steroidobacteraceae bacterium]